MPCYQRQHFNYLWSSSDLYLWLIFTHCIIFICGTISYSVLLNDYLIQVLNAQILSNLKSIFATPPFGKTSALYLWSLKSNASWLVSLPIIIMGFRNSVLAVKIDKCKLLKLILKFNFFNKSKNQILIRFWQMYEIELSSLSNIHLQDKDNNSSLHQPFFLSVNCIDIIVFGKQNSFFLSSLRFFI